ncbi:phytoene desaturase family protein [Acholeplasma granularum]|uniref:phytoene desaturase family protein n=1 Tax=Acholeplasma granularum TaxID=264635 RepID=UPI00046FA484|nr:phytoene desaturase family protein [Acholeplasma granularum]
MKKVAVIGAGTAGLASAIRLKSLGYDVTIYEKNDKIGGRMNQIKENGFTFDVGPTIVMMPKLYQEIFEVSGADYKDYIEMLRIDPMFEIQYRDRTTLTASNDLVRMTLENEQVSEEDAQGYMAYLAEVYKRYLVAKNHFIDRSFRKPSEFYNPKMLYQGLKLKTLSSAYKSISKYVKNEKLRQSLAFQTLYIGISPYNGPSIYTIIPMIELLYGVYYIKGGMYSMAKAMEKRFLEMGGKILLNQNVEEFIIENKNIKAIKVNGKISENYDAVLSNVDFPWAMNNLIKDNKNKGKYTPKKIDKMLYSSSSFILYIGTKKRYNLKPHTFFFTNDFNGNINDIFDGKTPDDPSYYVYAPSRIDSSMAPEGKESLYVLVPVPNKSDSPEKWDEKQTKAYTDKILDMMSYHEVFKDIKDNIEYLKVYTPNDFETQFNLQFGATFGLRPTLLQSNYYRPQNKFKFLNNLYSAGSSNHPGAGVPIVLNSAKLAVNELHKDLK